MIGAGTAIARKILQESLHLAGGVRAQIRHWRKSPPRVLLLKTWNDRLGDLVLVTGTLRHYRQLYAGCRLELACPDLYVDLFRHSPHLDAVVPLSSCFQMVLGKRQPSAWNAGRYDRVVFLRRPPRTKDYRLLESFGPAWTAGMTGDRLLIDAALAAQHEARLDLAVPVPVQNPPVHELDMQLALLRAQGAEVKSIDELWPEFWTRPDDGKLPAEQLRGISRDHPVIVFSPCGNAAIRDWNPASFLRVFEALAPCTLVLAGTERDARFIEGMGLHGLGGVRVVDLVGKTSLNELVETIRRADLVLGTESGVFHVAAALRKPVVCIAGGGHWGRFVPWGLADRTRVLTNRLDCFGCGWKCIRPTVECIQDISVEQVVRAVRELRVNST
jgi:ADP-heptose:LPS heptosyltransferase